MERNVMGELNVYRGSGAKPNFSEIARRHGMDRHTVAKYWREGESAADGRSARGSAFDPLEEVIRAKAQLPGMTKMAVYAFLREGRGEGLPGYGAFTAWCRARDVPFGGAGGREPHPRFETPPGRQLQFDWKEGMRLVDSEGEVFEFSVFTATLGYSRKHRFIPVRSRTLDDLLSCLLATFTRLGGVPEECITDNMSCLVTVSGRRRTRQERAWRFAREAGFELRLCAPRSPQMLASIYFSPFSPTYFRQSRQRGCAGFANADAPLSASRLPPPSRPHRRWIRPSGGTTVPLS